MGKSPVGGRENKAIPSFVFCGPSLLLQKPISNTKLSSISFYNNSRIQDLGPQTISLCLSVCLSVSPQLDEIQPLACT